MKLFIFVLFVLINFISCIPYRTLNHAQPQIGDCALFPQVVFPASETPYLLPCKIQPTDNKNRLHHFLHKTGSFAFLVIHQDTIINEYYLLPELKQLATDAFSLSKVFVATTVCVALQEGYIGNLEDTLGKYISGLPGSYQNIRIIDLLNMRSGIKTTFRNTAQIYYSNHLNRTSLKAPIISSGGKKYRYSNQSTQLLITLLEKSTQREFTDYFFEKIWEPMQMEHKGYWSLDSKKYHTARGFAGLSLTARDIAKLGLLYLHNGCLNHHRIIPVSWIDYTLSPAEELRITPEFYYHLQWKIITPGEEFLAKGLAGQYLYINKRTNTIIVRLGFRNTSTDWPIFFRHLSKQMVLKSDT